VIAPTTNQSTAGKALDRSNLEPGRGRAPTILLACLNGFSVRYLLRTDVLKTLKASGARCVVLFGGADTPEFQKEFADDNVFVRKLRNEEYRNYEDARPLARLLKVIKRFTLNGRYDTSTVDTFFRLQRMRAKSLGQRIASTIEAGLVAFLKRSTWARSAVVWLENRLFAPAFHQDVFDEFRPELVVVTTLGYLDYDYYIMREARKNGARIVSVILSWDNTSSKGIGGIRADHVITWTENMKQEVVEFHDYPPKHISVGGVAHFDDYLRDENFLNRSDFLALFELDPNRKILFYAAKSPSAYPWNPEIIEILAEAIAKGKFAAPCQLIARVHPAQFVKKHAVVNSTRTVQEVDWERYQEIQRKYKYVHFSVPQLRVGAAFDIDARENIVLGSLLRYSDVVINCFSTINLEACIFDRPTVNVAFNGTGKSPSRNPRHDIAIDEMQTHNQRVVRSGGVQIARSPEQLIQSVNDYLKDASLDRQARSNLVATECGGHLGKAGVRIAELITAQMRNEQGLKMIGVLIDDWSRETVVDGPSFSSVTKSS